MKRGKISSVAGALLAALLTCGAALNSAAAESYTVTSTADPGSGTCTISDCTLRDAITAANSNSGADDIVFGIPGSGVQIIHPLDPLPAITEAVTIDGTTQSPGSATPPIFIRGDVVSANAGLVVSAPGSTIKGLIIGNFPNNGIELSNAANTTISFTWIGVDDTGAAQAYNAGTGILITNSPNTTIGGAGASARTVISGNAGYGISISDEASTGITIKGSYIGTNALGTAAIPNTGGIEVVSSNNIIGGTAAGEGNVIAGLGLFPLYQIYLNESDGNQIYGNYIGTNAAGDASLSMNDGIPMGSGIKIHDGKNNIVGTPGAGNVISGQGTGIEMTAGFTDGLGSTGNKIQSNLIGTNAAGTAAVPNVNGMRIFGVILNPVSNNTIGGINTASEFYGNVISGNGLGKGTGRAIDLIGPLVQGNKVQGNYIGVGRNGVTPLGNTGPGVLLDANNTQIGGAGAGNILAYSGETGITILNGTGNRISQNKIFGNAGLGIDEGALSGANPVDPGDADTGPNNFQNFPEFGVTIPSKGKILVRGGLESTPSETFELEFFLNASVDDSGYGEGETFITSISVTTDAQGKASFTVPLTGTLPANGSITATSTDSLGNSSEFSLSVQPTRDLTQGTKLLKGPVVADVEEVVTISLPLFQAPKKPIKKPKKAGVSAIAKRRPVVEYEVKVANEAGKYLDKIKSRRNIVTVRNLPPGNYTSTYRAKLTEGKSTVAATRPSPLKSFTVRPKTGGASE